MWTPLNRPNFSFARKRKFVYDDPNSFLLSKPVTKKINNENVFTTDGLEIGHSSMQGFRKVMEDEHIIENFLSIENHTLVGIMDGHAGDGASNLTSIQLIEFIEETDSWKEYIKTGNVDLISAAFVQAYIAMDQELRVSDFTEGSGCTCVCAIITPTHIVCANVGDSRCVIASNNQTISMTEDHKPSLPEERNRIEAANGFVQYDRVNGELAMSRALGDFQYKNVDLPLTEQQVICIPDVSVHERKPTDELIILACDGVWVSLSFNFFILNCDSNCNGIDN